MSQLLGNLLVFGHLLRSAGIDVHLGRLMDMATALQHVDITSRDQVRHTCRALLIHRHEQFPTFDRAFDAFWRHRPGGLEPHRGVASTATHTATRESPPPHTGSCDAGDPSGTRVAPGELPATPLAEDDGTAGAHGNERTGASDVEGLAMKDFAAFTDEEIAMARVAMQRLRWSPDERRTRRWSAGRGPRIDLRGAIARSLCTGGDVVALPTRRRRTSPRRLVLLCDVSGSMERHSRVLLHFAHAIGQRHRLEAFLFSTQLTRITRELRAGSLDEVLPTVARAVPDFSGGTRIGASLKTLHQRWGRRVLGSSVVVLVISDGWDRGDFALLREQVARLQRSCHRLVWLTPLLGTPGYTPSTRGLEAALPFVDAFLPARTLTDLADLAVHLNTLGAFRRTTTGGYTPPLRDSKGRR